MEIKRWDRLIFIFALTLLAALILSRFIPKKSFSFSEETKQVTLIFTNYWGDVLGKEALTELVREFENKNRNINIRLQNLSYGEARDTLLQRGAGTEERALSGVQDIIALDGSWISALAGAEELYSLKAFTNSGEHGEWAVSLVSFMDVLYYNSDILKSSGFDRPPANREDFLKHARAIKGGYALDISLGNTDPQSVRRDIYSWIWASGTGLVHNGEPHFDSKGAADVLAFLGKLNQEHLLAPGIFISTGENALNGFATGKTAMLVAGIDRLEFLRKKLGDKLGITLIPGRQDFGKPGLAPRTWYAAISNRSAHPREAWEFISFLKGKAPFLAQKAGAVPGADLPTPVTESDPLYSKARSIWEAAEIFSDSGLSPVVDNIVREELLSLFESNRSGEETAKKIEARLRGIK